MTTMLGTPQHNSALGAGTSSGSGFGAHPSIAAASGAGVGHPPPAPSLQTLSGAMALAMDPAAQHAHMHFGGAALPSSSQGGAHSGVPPSLSISDAMAMSYNSQQVGPAGAQRGSSSSSTSSSSLLFGAQSDGSLGSAGMLGSSLDPLYGGGAELYGGAPLSDPLVDGALELSAVAKPFVPRFGSSPLASSVSSAPASSSLMSGLTTSPGPATTASPLLSSMLAPPPALSNAFGSSLSGSSLGGLNLGSALGGSGTWGNGSAESKISSYLSNLLPSELNLDEDNYEYGDANDIIPDLDSFLLGDN